MNNWYKILTAATFIYFTLLTHKKLTYVLLMTLLTLRFHAQELRFENVTAKIGIPSLFCIDMLQDTKGYIWLSTSKGLYRVNGNSATAFNGPNGIPDNVTSMSESADSIVWLATSTKKIYTLKKDTFTEAPFSQQIQDKLENIETIYSLQFSANNDLYVNSSLHTFVVNTKTNKIKQITYSEPKSLMSYDCDSKYITPVNGRVFSAKVPVSRKIADTLPLTFHTPNGIKTIEINYPASGNMYDYYVNAAIQNDYTILELGYKLVIIKDNRVIQTYQFNNRILKILIDKTNGLWVGTVQGGLIHYSDFLNPKTKKQYLSGANVQDILIDYENNIWIATLNNGIYRSSSLRLEDYTTIKGLNKKVSFQKGIDSALHILSSDNCFFKIDSILSPPVCFNINPSQEHFKLIRKYKNDYLLFSNGGIYITDKHFKTIQKTSSNPIHNWLGVVDLDPGDTLPLQGVSASYLINAYAGKTENRVSLPSTITAYCKLDSRNVLIGTEAGLYKVNSATRKVERIAGIMNAVNVLFKSKNGTFIIGTVKEGLYTFDNKTLTRIDKIAGLPLLEYNGMDEDSQGRIWCATSEGIYCLMELPHTSGFLKLDETIGLPDKSILNVCIYKENVYFSVKNGLYRFAIHNALLFTEPKFFITAFKTTKQTYSDFSKRITLPSSENTVTLSFENLTFEAIHSPRLIYELSGKINRTDSLNSSVLVLNNLPSGDYQLTVFAANSKLQKSKACIKIQFSVEPPFYLKTWFIAGIAITVCVLLVLINRLYITRIKKREEENNRINKLINASKLTAIQAQMNPHFIFNSINSIQNYILQKKEKDAYTYLAKFSKLIRMVLHHSDKTQIALYEEIDLMRTYIEIEQLRFDNSFDYEINVDDSVNEQEIFIPPMLIQPYIENAIWHGIMHLDKQRKGLLAVSFIVENQLLKISIQDNGVGRKESLSYKKDTEHKPVAMSLSQKRLEIMADVFKQKNIAIHITDLVDTDNNATGTRIELYLPLTLQGKEYDYD